MILSDNDLRDLWRRAGGTFHGPKTECGSIEEASLLPFLRHMVEALAWYKEIAQSANRYMRSKNEYAAGQSMLSLVVEISTDNGRRAEEALK